MSTSILHPVADPWFGHAVVVGGSVGGLAAAAALARHFDSVTVLDRDLLPGTAEVRKGVPQGRHAHALLAGGAIAIETLLPGVFDEMMADGADSLDYNGGIWYQAGGYRAASLNERPVVGASRPFVEHHLRRRVGALANVQIRDGVKVRGLVERDGRVQGVSIDAGERTVEIGADLVVDTSGRGSQAPAWLGAIGVPAPTVKAVHSDTRYATMLVARTPGAAVGAYGVVIETPPVGKRACFLLPTEGGNRWLLTLSSSFGAPSPDDEAGMREIVAGLPAPEIHRSIVGAEALSPVATLRFPSSRRRRYESMRRVPAGFVALGDAICSFNPTYGQGMSSATMQAVELGGALLSRGNGEAMVKDFYRRAAQVIDTPWKISVGSDFAYPECRGDKPVGTDLINAYMKRVLVAAHVSPEVNTAMITVQHLLARPESLMRPSMVRTVLKAARQARATRSVGDDRPDRESDARDDRLRVSSTRAMIAVDDTAPIAANVVSAGSPVPNP